MLEKFVSIKHNLIANYLGQGWTALMGLAFIPLYVKYLGIEAYGLIGLFAVMQAWLALLDMGMSPTLGREMARFTAGEHTPQSIRVLLRSLEIIVYGIAIVIGVGIWAGSEWLASDWVRSENLSVVVVAQALSICALVVALRFCEGIYRSAFIGLQRQVWYNCANAFLATIRHGGAFGILMWVSPTITAFFIWQAIISLMTLAVYTTKLYVLLPSAPKPVKFSSSAIAEVGHFAGGMIGITLCAILLTQVDKVILSRLLTLKQFGYYTLAGAVAGALPMVIGPITQAFYPRIVELQAIRMDEQLSHVYHVGSQLVTLVTAPAVCLICLFPWGVLYLWSGDVSVAQGTAKILSPLMLGFFLNGLMWMPYQSQLAYGWTSLALKSNIIAVLILIPAIFWVVPIYGAVGAAWIWVGLNTGYVIFTIHFMHRRILAADKWRWYRADVLIPAGGAFLVTICMKTLQPKMGGNRLIWGVFLSATGIISFIVAMLLCGDIRRELKSQIRTLLRHAPEGNEI